VSWWLGPLGAAIGGAAGKVLGKVAEWVPSREQSRRTKIDKIKREIDEITNTKFTLRSYKRYESLLHTLRLLEEDLQNR